MTLNKYQEKAMSTCMPSSKNFMYMFLNLVGEVGELAEKVQRDDQPREVWDIIMTQRAVGDHAGVKAKNIRKSEDHALRLYKLDMSDEEAEEIKKEAGDILWQLSGLCSVMGWELEDIAKMNLDKLASRKKRGVIDGNGDNR